MPTYGYVLEQSSQQESVLEQSSQQESVMSLEDMMGGKDSVTFDHCSMFIDVIIECDSGVECCECLEPP